VEGRVCGVCEHWHGAQSDGIIVSFLEIALVGIAVGLVLLTGRSALPSLFLLMRPARLRCWFLDSGQEAEVLSASPALDECLQRLKAQHFFLLGVKVEKLPLWGQLYREVALAARDHSAFASVVLHPFGAPASVYLHTPLAGGGMAFTRDFGGGAQAEGDRLSVRNVPTEDLELLVREHRARVQSMQERGVLIDLRPSQAGRLAATRAFYASDYFRRVAAARLIPTLAGFGLSIILLLWAILTPYLD
jgi:hypothetical protein